MSGNYENRRKRSSASKALMLVAAFVLVVGISVTGTLAWLTAKTPEVKNTFTSANLVSSITLLESVATEQADGTYQLGTEKTANSQTYNVLPGVDLPKDPTITITDLEEYAYLYINVDDQLASKLDWELDTDWTAVGDAYPGVYYYTGSSAVNGVLQGNTEKPDFSIGIIKDNQVQVADDYAAEDGKANTLSFTAYLVQATGNGENAVEAWANTYGKQ